MLLRWQSGLRDRNFENFDHRLLPGFRFNAPSRHPSRVFDSSPRNASESCRTAYQTPLLGKLWRRISVKNELFSVAGGRVIVTRDKIIHCRVCVNVASVERKPWFPRRISLVRPRDACPKLCCEKLWFRERQRFNTRDIALNKDESYFNNLRDFQLLLWRNIIP